MTQADERGRIPDLIKIGSIQSDMNMEIDTDILDPVVKSETFARFVLNNKGFLHSFSKIIIGCNAGDSTQTFPSGVGVHSLIQRCALKVGTKTIAEIDDFAHWMAYKSTFIENDINYDRETYLTHRIIAHEFNFKNGSGVAKNSDVNASNYYLKGRREPTISDDSITLQNGSGSVFPLDVSILSHTPLYSINLSDLFPFLRFNQLPLYMMDQQVSIELHFTPSSTLYRTVNEGDQTSGTINTIDLNNLQFVADYIYYDGDLMEQYRNANQTMNWNYVDYRLNKRSLAHATLNTDKIILDVGGAGRIVSKVIAGLFDDTLPKPDLSVLNVFKAVAPGVSADGNNQQFTTNLRYNDHYIYPIDRDNYAIHFNDVIQGEGNVPHYTREEYCNEGKGAISTGTGAIGWADNDLGSNASGLAGNFFWNVYRLNRNERVNSRGIELELQYSKTGFSHTFNRNHTHRAWLELLRTATLSNGMFDIDYA